jgi:hypothetical protein
MDQLLELPPVKMVRHPAEFAGNFGLALLFQQVPELPAA